MKRDYAELVHKIPELLLAVTDARVEEQEFLEKMEESSKQQIAELKAMIEAEHNVSFYSSLSLHSLSSLLQLFF